MRIKRRHIPGIILVTLLFAIFGYIIWQESKPPTPQLYPTGWYRGTYCRKPESKLTFLDHLGVTDLEDRDYSVEDDPNIFNMYTCDIREGHIYSTTDTCPEEITVFLEGKKELTFCETANFLNKVK